MAETTTNNFDIVVQGGTTESLKIANGVVTPIGAIVQNESGFANNWDETGAFLGVVEGGDSRLDDGVLTGNTSDDNPPRARIRTGATLCHLDSVGGSPTVSGVLVYSGTNNVDDLTVTDTTNPPVGIIKEWRSATDIDVRLFTPGEFQAGIADATWNS